MSGYIGATGYSENQEELDTLKDEIDANASYINNLVGIPDPTHTAIFGINILNPGLFGLVERAEVNISLLQSSLETEGTTITGIQEEITAIQSEVSGIQTEILGIQGEITGIDSSISSIQFVQLPALSTSLAILIGATDVIAVDARNKANKALGIWDEDGDNVYHKKSGNVGIGTTFSSVLTNKLEVNGNINIPTGSTFRIGDEAFNYSHLAGTPPVSSKWTNATDVATNIYYNTGNVGIGVTTAINNKLEVNGNINIPTGSKYKINNVDLAFSDLGTLSYNSLSDKPTLFDGNYNSLSNKPTLFDGNYNSLTNKLTGGTNIQILNGAINNLYSYTLPTAGVGSGASLGGVKVDGSTINITNGVISASAGTIATTTSTGVVKIGNGLSIIADGTLSLVQATTVNLGGVRPDGNTIITNASTGTISSVQTQADWNNTDGSSRAFIQNKPTILNSKWSQSGTQIWYNGGNVGIGTNTNTSGVLLDVNGTIESRTGIGASSIFYFRGVANSDINRVISAGQFSTGSAVNDMVIRSTNKLVLQSGIASPAIVIDTANNVGIGTTAPTSKLHIPTPDVATPFALLDFRNNNNFGIYATSQSVASRGNTLDFLARDYNLNGTIQTRNVLSLRPEGNVGVNTTNPSQTLDVNGATIIRGTLTLPVDSVAIASGGNRTYYINNGGSIYWGYGGDLIHMFRNPSNNNIFTISLNGTVSFANNVWHRDLTNNERLYFAPNATTYLKGYGGSTIVEFRNGVDSTRATINSNGQFACHFQTIPSLNTDHLGVNSNTGENSFGYYFTFVLYNTFTGFHRCYYEDDDIFNNDMSKEEIDIFKNNYNGRIVISTGKIKTDLSRTIPNEETEDDGNRPSNYEEIKNVSANVEWYSGIDKDGITIEEAIPIVQLCRVKKDKRVYGVLGSADRKTNNKNRLIVNSVGEGAICVCNTNGNIENGDYIQSSELLGFGEKQDDDILHNYSVAKAVMDCTFELDSPYYQCYELEGGVRVAFIACTYHCG